MKTALIMAVLMACLPAWGSANQPMDALKQSVDQSLRILNDPAYSDDGRKAAQRRELWRILEQIFDFREFSRRVLARHWHKFTPQEQADFVELFGDFVHIYYLSRLQDRYNSEQLIYLDQNLIGNSKAVVNVEVTWKYKNIPVEIKMIKRGDAWKIYDLSTLGIGAVSFYRSQFRAVLRDKPPGHVLDILRKKIKKSEEKVRQKYSHKQVDSFTLVLD
jgi:phospholipid transport system substrate-binding protein